MATTISGGTKITATGDPVTVTLSCVVTHNGKSTDTTIAIQFGGVECHAVQVYTDAKVVGGRPLKQNFGKDSGGFNDYVTSDPASPEWRVDTTSAASPYFDFGYSAETQAGKFTMVDGPSMEDPSGTVTSAEDYTGFEAYTYCISDKNVIGVVNWGVVKKTGRPMAPWAKLIDPERIPAPQWWLLLFEGRGILNNRGFNGSLYLPFPAI